MTQVGTEEVRELTLHGERIVYRRAGSGPVLVLVHGITSDSRTWERVMPRLARDFTVIAPDLIGHGESAKPRGDYSLGAHASGLRDIMAALGCDRATFVGHSLGGGIVMQLAYQYPELCERLVLVDSGGLGRDVSMLLRAATLPGSEFVMPLLAAARVFDAARILTGALGRIGLRPSTSDSRRSRRRTARSQILARARPSSRRCAPWWTPAGSASAPPAASTSRSTSRSCSCGASATGSSRSRHARATHAEVKGSRLEVFADAGHFPQLDEPARFAEALVDFVGGPPTPPCSTRPGGASC